MNRTCRVSLTTAGVALLLIAFAVAAMGVKNPETLIIVTGESADSLEPAYAFDSASQEPLLNIYEPLIAFEEGEMNVFVPLLAVEVPTVENGLISEDGLTYTFPIRTGVRFHNGNELTPEDVEYTFERAMVIDPEGGPIFMICGPLLGVDSTRDSGGNVQVTFDQIDRAVEVRDNSIVFHLVRPDPSWLQILALTWSSIVDKEWVISQGGWPGDEETWLQHNNPKREDMTLFDIANGTGAFRLDRWMKESEIVMARNDNYWREPAYFREVRIKIVPEWTTRMLMLRNGDADIVQVPAAFLSQVESLEDVRVIKGLPAQKIYLVFFNQNVAEGSTFIGSGELDGEGIPPDFFSNLDIRQAFNYIFDYETCLSDIFAGDAVQPNGPIPVSVPYRNPSQPTYSYDPTKAIELFKAAYDGKLWEVGFTLTMPSYAGDVEDKAVADLLRANLLSINPKFKIDPIVLQWSTYYSTYTQGWTPVTGCWWGNDYPDPHSNVFPFMHSQGYYSIAQGFTKYDALVEKGVSTLDPAVREEVYRELQELAYEDAIDIFTAQPTEWHVEREWVKGWYRYPSHWMNNYYYAMWKE